jgi:hypothetical protein
MRGQLTHLIRMAERPGVTIQILPFEVGARAWFGTSFFLILGLGVPSLETVILERPAAFSQFADDESITRYRNTFDGLSKSALPAVTADSSPTHERRDSWRLIQYVLYSLQKGRRCPSCIGRSPPSAGTRQTA